ncbi:sigma-70 family RNA polymerase sigma factor [Allofournierella massiliensis]|uniref:sigma-70 family RNA polymerase sigma factor n=1 Tax=Allofournierella massiliensis TaxID=1650663 RepID=UPI003563CF9F
MQTDHAILEQVAQAKTSLERADELIRQYQPFIKAQASRALGRLCTEQDDAFSIGMIAFHEAIRGYSRARGSFLQYAALVIRSRIRDEQRRERRHIPHARLDQPGPEEGHTLGEQLADPENPVDAAEGRLATQAEIRELTATMAGFGIALSDVAENCPRQRRTLEACRQAVRYAREHPELLEELLHTGKLPLARLCEGSGVARKTLERHRKYVTALLLIYTNGYEIIRGHICQMLAPQGGERPA